MLYFNSGIVSDEADFLFAYATPINFVQNLTNDCSAYIKAFVEILKEKLNHEHLEEALLMVKQKVAEKVTNEGGKLFRHMPSVVSQMTDKVWFNK